MKNERTSTIKMSINIPNENDQNRTQVMTFYVHLLQEGIKHRPQEGGAVASNTHAAVTT